MIDLISSNLQPIATLCQTYGVQKLEVFGSATTDAFDLERSDIDFIVTFADESPGLARRFVDFAESLEGDTDGKDVQAGASDSDMDTLLDDFE